MALIGCEQIETKTNQTVAKGIIPCHNQAMLTVFSRRPFFDWLT